MGIVNYDIFKNFIGDAYELEVYTKDYKMELEYEYNITLIKAKYILRKKYNITWKNILADLIYIQY